MFINKITKDIKDIKGSLEIILKWLNDLSDICVDLIKFKREETEKLNALYEHLGLEYVDKEINVEVQRSVVKPKQKDKKK